jgi:hypothetical protein
MSRIYAKPRDRSPSEGKDTAPPGQSTGQLRGLTRLTAATLDAKTSAVSTTPTTTHQGTLGAVLERDRLEHRARRVAFAIVALRRLADASTGPDPVPTPMRQAIDGFSAELAHINQRLREL